MRVIYESKWWIEVDFGEYRHYGCGSRSSRCGEHPEAIGAAVEAGLETINAGALLPCFVSENRKQSHAKPD